MKFDYIIGNPPYQDSTHRAGKGSSKLYFKISKRMFTRYLRQMAFITPKPILMDGSQNSCYEFVLENVEVVDDADAYFKEATNAVSWILSRPNTKRGELKYNDIVVDNLYEMYSENAKEFYPILRKISPRHNGMKKLLIRPSHSPIGHRAQELTDEKTPDAIEVLHQSNGDGPKGRKIKYLLGKPKNNEEMIVVPYASKWFTPFRSGNPSMELSEFFGVIQQKDYPLEQFDNIISFLSTDTIRDFILEHSKMTGSNYFNGLWQLPEVDFSIKWDDKMAQKYFNL